MKYFKESEFDSPDQPGSGCKMDPDLLLILDDMRSDCGFPFEINSGYRSESHNKLVGGSKASAHRMGNAVDIKAVTSREKFMIVQSAINHGIKRIGIGKTFVHIDNAYDYLPFPCIWTY